MKNAYLLTLTLLISSLLLYGQGATNYALSFDGTNDRISLTSPFSGNVDQYTVEGWFYSRNQGNCGSNNYRRMIGFNGFELEIAVCSNKLQFYDGSGWKQASVNVNDNRWHHVAIVRDSPDYRIYIDGKEALSYQRNNNLNFTGDFSIGAKSSGGEWWKGLIDEVRLWSTVRSEEDINCYLYQPLDGSEPGLEGYWPMNEGPGSLQASDESVANRHGKLFGMNVNNAWKVNSLLSENFALKFDGVNDRVAISSPFSGNLNQYTAEAWFLSENAGACGSGQYRRILGFSSFQLELAVCGNNLRVFDGKAWMNTNVNVNDGDWHHVAVSRNRPDFTVYIDGDEVLSYQRNNTLNFTGNLSIGSNSSGTENWKGYIDEVRLWNIARDQADIQGDRSIFLQGTESGLVGYWPLNEGTGATKAVDKTGNKDGILVGFDYNLAWEAGFPTCDEPIGIIPDTICDISELEFEIPHLIIEPGYQPSITLHLLDSDMNPIPNAFVSMPLPNISKKNEKLTTTARELMEAFEYPTKPSFEFTCDRYYNLSFDVVRTSPSGTKEKESAFSERVYVMCCGFLPDDPVECSNNMIEDAGFYSTAATGNLPFGNWKVGYGNPKLQLSTDGYGEKGTVLLTGRKSSGSALAYGFPSTKIEQGKNYRLTFAAKLSTESQLANYKIRALAYNGVLASGSSHPQPSADVALIGQTGTIVEEGWTIISLPVWPANKDFSNLAITIFNEDNERVSRCEIDNVCLVESDLDPCEDLEYDESGNPIMPSYIDALTSAPGIEEETEISKGSLQDLYGHLGYGDPSSLGDWYENWKYPCHTIGGYVPPEAENWDGSELLNEMEIDATLGELLNAVGKVDPPTLGPNMDLSPFGDLPDSLQCPPFQEVPGKPFGGRDIIFVHGLKLKHLCDRSAGVPGADLDWNPTAIDPFPAPFYDDDGYYRNMALETWEQHINTYVKNTGNRYLVVNYNCSQGLETAAHTILHQIKAAIQSGKNVWKNGAALSPNPNEPCFGKDAVIISHSTGGPVVDAAMAIAHDTGKPISVWKSRFGEVDGIPASIRAHIALAGAFTGSDLAAAVVGAGIGAPGPVEKLATQYIVGLGLTGGVCGKVQWENFIYPKTLTSILVDLTPVVTTTIWGPIFSTSPVPVLLVPGGHPTALGTIGKLLHKGFDDGVVSMSCACAQPVLGAYKHKKISHIYDMGQNTKRAIPYFVDQIVQLQYMPGYTGDAAGACTPWKSVTGMVQHKAVAYVSKPFISYPRHYTFAGSASDHFVGPRGVDMSGDLVTGLGFDPPKHYSKDGSVSNREEILLVNDSKVFEQINGSQLVDDAIMGQEQEDVKEKSKTFSIKIPKVEIKIERLWLPKVKVKIGIRTISWKIVLWRRTYHRLNDFENKGIVDYVYDFVLTK